MTLTLPPSCTSCASGLGQAAGVRTSCTYSPSTNRLTGAQRLSSRTTPPAPSETPGSGGPGLSLERSSWWRRAADGDRTAVAPTFCTSAASIAAVGSRRGCRQERRSEHGATRREHVPGELDLAYGLLPPLLICRRLTTPLVIGQRFQWAGRGPSLHVVCRTRLTWAPHRRHVQAVAGSPLPPPAAVRVRRWRRRSTPPPAVVLGHQPRSRLARLGQGGHRLPGPPPPASASCLLPPPTRRRQSASPTARLQATWATTVDAEGVPTSWRESRSRHAEADLRISTPKLKRALLRFNRQLKSTRGSE